MRCFLALYIILLLPGVSFSADFIVVSNADSGPGTLRDAINKANANGTAESDLISFNLPGGTLADRTITLVTNLPGLTSNITIDGTTQPGVPLGRSDAKVIVQSSSAQVEQQFALFTVENTVNVSLFGMKMLNNFRQANANRTTCIKGNAVRSLRVGAPGKGNIIAGWDNGFYVFGDVQRTDNSLIVQSSFIGLLEDGETPDHCDYSFTIDGFGIVTLGGDQPQEGNTMAFSGPRLPIPPYGLARITICNNRLGTNLDGTKDLSLYWGENTTIYPVINIQRKNEDRPYQAEVVIKDNLISGTCGSAILIEDNEKSAVIQGNRIGTDITGTLDIGSSCSLGIDLRFCSNVLIGGDGPGEGNTIAFTGRGAAEGYGIQLYGCTGITMSRNSTFCNMTGGIKYFFYDEPERPPFIYINTITTNKVAGKASPGAIVELFYNDECPNCEGKTYFATIQAGTDGLWEYNGILQPLPVVATATGTDGATSEYSHPRFDDSRIEIVPAGCNGVKGGIKGVEVLSGVSFYWENESGDIVGTGEYLENMPTGKYRLVIGSQATGNNCTISSPYYEITEEMPGINTDNMTIVSASCGQKNGAIQGVSFTGDELDIAWKNVAGDVVSVEVAPKRLWPGKYTVEIHEKRSGCAATAGPFDITDLGGSGPVIDITGALVSEATCELSNGAIRNVKVNGVGSFTYNWEDETGQQIGNTPDLLNVKAGNYILKVKDVSACPASESDPVTVPAQGEIRFDDVGVRIDMVTCSGNKGAVTGITATGADTYKWENAVGQTVGNQLALTGVEAGLYTLVLSNSDHCESRTRPYEVQQEQPVRLSLDAYNITPPSCNLDNGAVTGVDITGGVIMSCRWLNGEGTEVADGKDLRNMPDGEYRLFVIDAKGCEQVLLEASLLSPDLPAIDESGMIIKDDECNRKEGSIKEVKLTGETPLRYSWYDQTGAIVGTSANLQRVGSGVYYLYVEDKWGCHAESNRFTIRNINNAPPVPLLANMTIVKGMPARLKVTNPGNGIYSLYHFDNTSTILEQNSTGEFLIRGLTESTGFYVGFHTGDCISPLSPVKVDVIDDVKIFIPTAFSPNNDGTNDRFRITAYGIADVHAFRIFDRWGYEVFTTRDIVNGWDGKIRQVDAPTGSYVWSFEGVDIKGERISRYGIITLVR